MVISEKEIADGFLYEDWGTLEEKSSRSLFNTEKAGRTG